MNLGRDTNIRSIPLSFTFQPRIAFWARYAPSVSSLCFKPLPEVFGTNGGPPLPASQVSCCPGPRLSNQADLRSSNISLFFHRLFPLPRALSHPTLLTMLTPLQPSAPSKHFLGEATSSSPSQGQLLLLCVPTAPTFISIVTLSYTIYNCWDFMRVVSMCHFCLSLDFYCPDLEHTRQSTDIANLII